MAAESLDALVSAFLAKVGSTLETPQDLLKGFVAFLKERGQFLEPGDMAKQFVETRTVLDKNKVQITISECHVCGGESYEVAKPES